MKPELQQRISAIKAECEEILRLGEKLDPWKWKTRKSYIGDGYDVYPLVNNKRKPDVGSWTEVAECDNHDGKNRHNASFIAHARNVSPAMARVVVVAIWQWEIGPELGYMTQEVAEAALKSIADQWEGK